METNTPEPSARRSALRTGSGPRSMRLFSVSVKTGEVKTFHPSTNWLNHVQCSPTDPALALFCHEGPWHEVDRIWTIRVGSDEARLMHRRSKALMEDALIGATAKIHGFTLATRNIRDFQGWDLKLVNPFTFGG